ncbi:MAG: hypothetical protein AB7E16_04835 [Candidatus Izemoplasmatales bacterium]
MNFYEINPDNLNMIANFFYALNYLIKLYNDFINKQKGKLLTTFEMDELQYDFIEILYKIYEILPVKTKLNYKNVIGGIIQNFNSVHKDNLFDEDIKLDFLTSKLLDIVKENEKFFFFNYMLRNANAHYKGNVEPSGHFLSSQGFKNIELAIIVDKKADNYLFFNCLDENSKDLFPLEITTIYNKNSYVSIEEHKYIIKMTIDVVFIKKVIEKIRNAFIDGLSELKEFISVQNNEPLHKIYSIPKERYMSYVSYWEERISTIN